jgi:hypothetical protein
MSKTEEQNIKEYLESVGQMKRLGFITMCSEFNKAINLFINEVKKVNPTLNNEVISAVLMTSFFDFCVTLNLSKEEILSRVEAGLKLYIEEVKNEKN